MDLSPAIQAAHPVVQEMPDGFRLADVEVRLATAQERVDWDGVMNAHHYLGFQRFASRGLRYVAVWRGQWVALAGWQNGAFKCKPRDRWIGWKSELQFDRLRLLVNNTRFLVLAETGVFPNLATYFLSAMTRRLADDWLVVHGHSVLVAETFCDPEKFVGTMYTAAGWQELGLTRGYSRSNGRYTDKHGQPKQMLVRPLRRDARRLLACPQPLPVSVMPPAAPELAPRDPAVMRSLYQELAAIPDYRRAQGKKHSIACVLTVHILATLANMKGCIAAAQFAGSLTQEELKTIGAWQNPKTGDYVPVAKSTIHRVVQSIDPEALEDVLARYSSARLPLARALSADGKRLRGANRNGEGHYETVALIDHATGAPVAMLGYGDEGGEKAAVRDLLERADIRGKVITIDALHTVRNTARLITESLGADYVMTVKGNASETFALLEGIDWEQDDTGQETQDIDERSGRITHHEQDIDKAHGRIEQRSIDVMTPIKGMINYPGVNQIARVHRYREKAKLGQEATASEETVYLITSLDAGAASPEELLRLNRGHWGVENKPRNYTTGRPLAIRFGVSAPLSAPV